MLSGESGVILGLAFIAYLVIFARSDGEPERNKHFLIAAVVSFGSWIALRSYHP